jgi:multimeric flavodoxin WrbA
VTVLGIVGSPRKDGRSSRLVDAALEGARREGASVQKLYLVDYDVKSFKGAGGSDEAYSYCPDELSTLCGSAEALVLGAPVYWGDINGLTKDFMDTVTIGSANGKPALGIAIAGGTGKGLLSGVQSIYHFFYHKQMRGIDPTPVSRFNMEKALQQLTDSGARLARAAQAPTPFPGATRDERWPEVVAYYASVAYLDGDPVDEFLMLAEQLIDISDGDDAVAAQAELDRAVAFVAEGDRAEAGRHAVRSYQLLYFADA